MEVFLVGAGRGPEVITGSKPGAPLSTLPDGSPNQDFVTVMAGQASEQASGVETGAALGVLPDVPINSDMFSKNHRGIRSSEIRPGEAL